LLGYSLLKVVDLTAKQHRFLLPHLFPDGLEIKISSDLHAE
jgi:hypothetical protein